MIKIRQRMEQLAVLMDGRPSIRMAVLLLPPLILSQLGTKLHFGNTFGLITMLLFVAGMILFFLWDRLKYRVFGMEEAQLDEELTAVDDAANYVAPAANTSHLDVAASQPADMAMLVALYGGDNKKALHAVMIESQLNTSLTVNQAILLATRRCELELASKG